MERIGLGHGGFHGMTGGGDFKGKRDDMLGNLEAAFLVQTLDMSGSDVRVLWGFDMYPRMRVQSLGGLEMVSRDPWRIHHSSSRGIPVQ